MVKGRYVTLNHGREKSAIPIVNDGAIATSGVGEGSLVPVIIVDTSKRPDVDEIIRLHEFMESGNITITWNLARTNRKNVALLLEFHEPADVIIMINFNIPKQGVLVEQILTVKALYLQSGKQGDRVGLTMDNPKILMEIPDTGFRKTWDKLYYKSVVAHYKKQGLSRSVAKQAARDAITEIQRLGKVRMPS